VFADPLQRAAQIEAVAIRHRDVKQDEIGTTRSSFSNAAAALVATVESIPSNSSRVARK